MAEFKYSDGGDKLTAQLIGEEFDGAYWGRSEERVLRRAKDYLRERFGQDRLKTLSMLDLGCGMGRLIPEFAVLVGSVTGLEPDAERCAMAQRFLHSRGVQNARAVNADLGAYLASQSETPRFDVVLCSHIFQHFSHATFRGILEDLRRCTGPETVFIFTTTFTQAGENLYTYERFENGARAVTATDLAGFEKAVAEPDTLAVCLFSKSWMTDFLKDAGLQVKEFAAYHFQGEHDAEKDPACNADPEKLLLARDAFYICLPFDAPPPGPHVPLAAGKLSFMQFYSLKGELDAALHKLEEAEAAQEQSERLQRIQKDFATAEDFLYGNKLHFPARRFFFTGYRVRLGDIPIAASHVVVSVYAESALCQITVCLDIAETTVHNFVYLHQIQCSPFAPFTVNGEKLAIPGLCERLLEGFGLEKTDREHTCILIELNRLDGRDSYGPLTDDECRCLYGILTGDEGWPHVPAELARARMDNSWTSRDFVKAIAFSSNYLLLNFNRANTYDKYIKWQHGYADHYFGDLNDYFTMDAATAGLNHGVFLSVETGMVIRCTTDRLLMRKPDLTKHPTGLFLRKEIHKNKSFRREMIEILNKVETVNITEIGELDNLVFRSLGTNQKVQSIRSLLELLESDLDLAYQTRTNRMVNLLTFISLGIGVVQVILGWLALK